MITTAMIEHIEEHQAAFDELMLEPTDVREYFDEHSHIPDIYERLCSDLEIQPHTNLAHVIVFDGTDEGGISMRCVSCGTEEELGLEPMLHVINEAGLNHYRKMGYERGE